MRTIGCKINSALLHFLGTSDDTFASMTETAQHIRAKLWAVMCLEGLLFADRNQIMGHDLPGCCSSSCSGRITIAEYSSSSVFHPASLTANYQSIPHARTQVVSSLSSPPPIPRGNVHIPPPPPPPPNQSSLKKNLYLLTYLPSFQQSRPDL